MGYQVKINQLFLKQYRFALSIYLLGVKFIRFGSCLNGLIKSLKSTRLTSFYQVDVLLNSIKTFPNQFIKLALYL
jgi:hypothetical protein